MFIKEKGTQFLSVKLPYIGAIISLIALILQWALDYQLIPVEHQLIVTTLALPLLAHFGKKLMQPELHPPQLSDFAIQPLAKIPKVSANTDLAWMIEAKKHVGLREDTSKKRHNGIILGWLKSLGAWWKDDETAWCGVFTAHCLRVAGVKYPKHWYRALDYVNYGAKLTKPAYGCIAVKTRTGGGHVCFVVGRDKKTGKLVCLGGNQNNMVCYALYNESDFQAFMWYGVTSRPADHRYDLPVLDNVRATAVTEA